MARGAVRGAMAAWLGLIVLETLTNGDSSSKVGGAFDWAAGLFDRALDPKVAAIPDRSKNAGSAGSAAGGGDAAPIGAVAAWAGAGAANAAAAAAATAPGTLLGSLDAAQGYLAAINANTVTNMHAN